MHHNIAFIYRPTTGDRTFKYEPCDEVAAVEWSNGCRHVVGGYHVHFETSEPDNWWRDLAKKLLKPVARIAWDEGGVMNAVLTRRDVSVLYKTLSRVAEHTQPAAYEALEAIGFQLLEQDAPGVKLDMNGNVQIDEALHYEDDVVDVDDARRLVKYQDQEPIGVDGGVVGYRQHTAEEERTINALLMNAE